MEEDDLLNNAILNELAESMDDVAHGGFVSTFTLAPLAVNGAVDSFGGRGAETLASSPVDSAPVSEVKSDQFPASQSRGHAPQSTPNSGRSDIFRPTSPRSNSLTVRTPSAAENDPKGIPPPPPPDLLSPQSIASDCTDMVSNKVLLPASTGEDVGPTSRTLPPASSRHFPNLSFDTISTNASTPPRSGHAIGSVNLTGQSNIGDETSNSKPRGKSSHDKQNNNAHNNKRKKVKPSSRKNNLVILPWNNIRSKSDVSSNRYASSSAAQQHHHHAANNSVSQKSPPLPPPHPLSHVQSYPPQHHYYSGAHHFHSYSFASDASSSEATPIAGGRRHAYSVSSVDIGEPALSLGGAATSAKDDGDEEGGVSLLRFDRQNSAGTDANNDGDLYFQDFDDTLSKDSTGNNIPVRMESDLIGINIHMLEQPIVDVIPRSISANSLLGLTIPQREKHRQMSSLQYSPSTLVTFVDNGNAVMPMPVIPAEEVHIPPLTPETRFYSKHEDGEANDDGSALSNLPSVMDDTPPASPNPYLTSLTMRHHKHHSSLVSYSESCLQSHCSMTSLESYNILNYPNPDPQFYPPPEHLGTPHLVEENFSPLESSYSYEDDRSLCEEEKMFVQQIHNSGLSSLSFEHVEDTLEYTSMDVEVELVYNSGSFDNGSVGGGSVESGSVMSAEERKEIERRIDRYRKFRQKKRKSKIMADDRSVENGGDVQGQESSVLKDHAQRQDHVKIEDDQAVIRAVPATPVASNKTPSMQVYSTHNVDAIDEFNQQCDDQYQSLEMTPLTLNKSSTAFNHKEEDALGSGEAVKHPSYIESKLHPNMNSGWRPYYYLRNLIWWWQLQPSSFQNMRNGNSSSPNRTGQRPKYDYTYKGFDDVDFDRDSSYCYSCCRRCFCLERSRDGYHRSEKFWYTQTSWGKLLCIVCVFLLVAWVFSDGGLQKHRSQQTSYPDYHQTKHGYHLYDRDDPLSREQFLNPVSRSDDDVDLLAIPIEDDIDYSFAQKYFPDNKKQGVDVDDVLMQFEMEDDLFDELVDDIHSSQVVISDDSVVHDSAESILAGLAAEDVQSREIDTIVVLGERHVGIEWLVTKLKVLYPSITVSSGFPAGENQVEGMWFQPEADTNSNTMTKHILVIALFLNPYDWVELMRIDPINAPNHKSMEWKAFVESEWSPINHDSRGNNEVIDMTTANPKAKSAVVEKIPDDDDDAGWDDSVASKTASRGGNLRKLNSFYEVKMGGSEYYSSVLELRADKIRASVKGSLYRPDVFASLPVRYEDLIEPYKESTSSSMEALKSSTALPGIVGLVGRIQTLTGISPDAELTKSFFADPIGCTGHICRYPTIEKMRKNTEYIEYLNNHVDWHAEQLLGYQKMSTKPTAERIVVLGERHSGAEWLVDRLSRCFPDVEVAYGFDRPGKFFQSPPSSTINTLVVAVFTNPYDFIERMRQDPINAPAHANMEWSDFVTSTWERTRSHLDSSVVDTSTESCSFGFSFHEIIPCHTQRGPDSDDFPLYELRHPPSNGFDVNADKPYSNLLELRADKIQNFLSTAHYPQVVHLIKLRYEDLVWHNASYTDDASYLTLPFPGIAGLLETVRDHTTLTPDVSAGWILDEKGFFKAESLSVETGLDEDYMNWINDHVDWSVEALVGYGPQKKRIV